MRDIDDLAAQLRKLDTTAISDALDRLGIRGGCRGITAQVQGVKAVGHCLYGPLQALWDRKGDCGGFP